MCKTSLLLCRSFSFLFVLINLSVCTVLRRSVAKWRQAIGCSDPHMHQLHPTGDKHRQMLWVAHRRWCSGVFGESFHAANSWLCSDMLSLCGAHAVYFSPTHTSLSCRRCWQNECDKGSGWCACNVNYSHNLHHPSLGIHHLFATAGSDAKNKVHFGLTVLVKLIDNEVDIGFNRQKKYRNLFPKPLSGVVFRSTRISSWGFILYTVFVTAETC